MSNPRRMRKVFVNDVRELRKEGNMHLLQIDGHPPAWVAAHSFNLLARYSRNDGNYLDIKLYIDIYWEITK